MTAILITKSLRTILVLSYMFGVVYIRRNVVTTIYILSTPLSLMFLLLVLTKGSSVIIIVTGAVILTLMNGGLALGNAVTVNKFDFKYQDVIVASPIGQMEYLGGFALAELLNSMPALIVYFTIMLWGATAASAIGLVLLTLTIWITLSAFGFFLSSLFKDYRNSWELLALIGTSLSVIPPVFYPLNILPPFLQDVMLFIPTTHYSILAQAIFAGAQANASLLPFSMVYVVGFMVAALLLTRFRSRWREQ